MKKLVLILLIACVAFIGCEKAAEAHGRRSTTVAAEENFNVAGVKLDAPNLVTIGKGWTLGAEGGKDIIKNIFFDDNAFLEADKGYFAYVKVTYTGCLLRCKEE